MPQKHFNRPVGRLKGGSKLINVEPDRERNLSESEIEIDTTKNWAAAAGWGSDHKIVVQVRAIQQLVLDMKKSGAAVLSPVLSNLEKAFLGANLEMLSSHLTHPHFRSTLNTLWATYREDAPPADAAMRGNYSAWQAILGLGSEPATAGEEERAFAIAQVIAISHYFWERPAQGFIFAAAQYAAHNMIVRCQGENEDTATHTLLDGMEEAFVRYLIKGVEGAGLLLPPGQSLSMCYARLSKWRDHLSADFAIVTGIEINGRLKWRVVLFQAKWEETAGRANVGQNRGRQLAEASSTGIAYYVFYPAAFGERRPFLLPVRSAQEIADETSRNADWGKYRVSTTISRDASAVSTDFATFLAVKMASSTDESVGRLFDDISEVGLFLTSDPAAPLVPAFLAMDTTGRLDISPLIHQIRPLGFTAGDPVELALRPDSSEPIDDGSSAPEPGF